MMNSWKIRFCVLSMHTARLFYASANYLSMLQKWLKCTEIGLAIHEAILTIARDWVVAIILCE